MLRFRGFGLVAVLGLVVGVAGCTTASPVSSAQAADLHRQAQAALTRWDAAVAASGGAPDFVLVGERTLFVGNDWGPNIDAGNAKVAWYAGLFVASEPLPTDAPPAGSIRWQDGTNRAVAVISAQQALTDMKTTGGSPCPTCTPLEVTGARLTTATFQSSKGPAEVPAWEFSLKDAEAKLDQVAVKTRFAVPPVPGAEDQTGQWVGPSVMSATAGVDGITLTVSFVGAPETGDKGCGADYTADAVESDNAVVVIVYEHRNTLPVACTDVGATRTARVTLARPFGSRTLIDLQAQPISVTR